MANVGEIHNKRCDRILEVARIIAAGEWVPGETQRELEKRYGVSGSAVRGYRQAALIGMRGDDFGETMGEIRTEMLVACQRIRERAMANERPGDLNAAVNATRLQAQLVGALIHDKATVEATYEAEAMDTGRLLDSADELRDQIKAVHDAENQRPGDSEGLH